LPSLELITGSLWIGFDLATKVTLEKKLNK